ncbi:phospholipase D-like domain-containing protein [Amycolatopsis sp. NPDC005961]|uniref:phospholipase D-like domain-containing protein n=1 Tax=Amycolatopsis sp. NPDC005961 TaxID=3156720 RepID=UPI0033D342F5
MTRPFLPADPAVRLEAPTSGTEIEHLLGGDAALPRMLADIRSARGPSSFVYLASWNCETGLPVPHADNLGDALRRAAESGAQVRLLLWAGILDEDTMRRLPLDKQLYVREFFRRWGPTRANNLAAAKLVDKLRESGADARCHLDARHLFAGSHHQKIVVVGTDDDVIAYVGGIEFSTDRLNVVDAAGKPLKGAPLFDLSLRIRGAAAYSVLRTFTDRWTATVARPPVPRAPVPELRGAGRASPDLASSRRFVDMLGSGEDTAPTTAEAQSGLFVDMLGAARRPKLEAQVSHTYGRGCPFPGEVKTAGKAVAAAIRSARKFFYMEDQYYTGTAELKAAITDTLRGDPNRWGVVVMANEGAVADLPDVGYWRREFLRPLVEEFPGRFLVFERLGDDGTATGRTAYVHAKLTIVDDVTAVVGSANSNYRSWTHDSEILLTVHDPNGPGPLDPVYWRPIRRLRAEIWQRHLFITSPDPKAFGDPAAARPWWSEIAAERRKAHVRRSLTHVPAPRPALGPASDLLWTTVLDPRA